MRAPLAIRPAEAYLDSMTVSAAQHLEAAEKLAPAEPALALEPGVSPVETRQRAALRRLRGSSQSSGLLAKLLAARAQERARG